MSLSTKEDSSVDQRPLRYVLITVDPLAGALFFSEGLGESKEDDLSGGFCSRWRDAFSDLSAESGSSVIDTIGDKWQDGQRELLLAWGYIRFIGRQV